MLRVVQGPNANPTVTCVCGDLKGMVRGPASETTWVVENIPRNATKIYLPKQRNDNFSKNHSNHQRIYQPESIPGLWFAWRPSSPFDTAPLAFMIPLAPMMTMSHQNYIFLSRLCYCSQASHPRITSRIKPSSFSATVDATDRLPPIPLPLLSTCCPLHFCLLPTLPSLYFFFRKPSCFEPIRTLLLPFHTV